MGRTERVRKRALKLVGHAEGRRILERERRVHDSARGHPHAMFLPVLLDEWISSDSVSLVWLKHYNLDIVNCRCVT